MGRGIFKQFLWVFLVRREKGLRNTFLLDLFYFYYMTLFESERDTEETMMDKYFGRSGSNLLFINIKWNSLPY